MVEYSVVWLLRGRFESRMGDGKEEDVVWSDRLAILRFVKPHTWMKGGDSKELQLATVVRGMNGLNLEGQ